MSDETPGINRRVSIKEARAESDQRCYTVVAISMYPEDVQRADRLIRRYGGDRSKVIRRALLALERQEKLEAALIELNQNPELIR